LDAGADLERRTAVGALLVALIELDRLELVRPDRQGTSAGRLRAKVMSGVLDHKTKVEISGKVNRQLNMGNIRGLDDI
jgi:hypothetical protein